jgi:hypothetical protein
MASYGTQQRDTLTRTHHKANIREAVAYMDVIEVLEELIDDAWNPKELKKVIEKEKFSKSRSE